MKRWQYLLFSTALAVIVLSVGTGSYLAIVRQERLEALERAERDAEIYLEKLREAREQLREASDRLTELEEMLLNLNRTYHIVTGSDLEAAPLSRSGRQYTATTMPLLSPSGFSPARFERAFVGTGMAGLGEALCLAEAETGVNALALAGVIALESGWGSSKIARDKNNLAGLGACSGSAYTSAIRFGSRSGCVNFLARLLLEKYLTPGGKYYNGDNLLAVGKRYAEDPGWAAKVGRCMKLIAEAGVTP